jgi:hypothetical protein
MEQNFKFLLQKTLKKSHTPHKQAVFETPESKTACLFLFSEQA